MLFCKEFPPSIKNLFTNHYWFAKISGLSTRWSLGDLYAMLEIQFFVLFCWLIYSDDNALRWMALDPTDDNSALVQIMAWCLSQCWDCWPRSMSPYGVTRPQWVNKECQQTEAVPGTENYLKFRKTGETREYRVPMYFPIVYRISHSQKLLFKSHRSRWVNSHLYVTGPESVDLSIDGSTDLCSQGKDINFQFTGFGVVGQVSCYHAFPGLILGLHLAKERHHYKVKASLIGGEQT